MFVVGKRCCLPSLFVAKVRFLSDLSKQRGDKMNNYKLF